MERDWAASADWVWQTESAASGQHAFQVWVRRPGASIKYETWASYTHKIVGSWCSAVGVTFSPESPAAEGSLVTATASATCEGTASYQFWLLPPSGSWELARGWSSSAIWDWDTTGAADGIYTIQVWVRTEGSTGDYEAWTGATYQLATGSGGAA
jgi:hypothetical protein